MTSLQAINKVALLFMAVFLTGMIAIYQLRFEHREESYGISLAYGAQYKELYWEIFCEILLLELQKFYHKIKAFSPVLAVEKSVYS